MCTARPLGRSVLAGRRPDRGVRWPACPADRRDPGYLGDLGGLDQHARLVLLELRGSGGSEVPADPATYRCDRMVEDVEALREHLGLDQLDLLGHSAGGDLALLYAARYPERISRLIQRAAEAVALFPAAELAVQPGAAHIPWLHDPAWFTTTLAAFLAR